MNKIKKEQPQAVAMLHSIKRQLPMIVYSICLIMSIKKASPPLDTLNSGLNRVLNAFRMIKEAHNNGRYNYHIHYNLNATAMSTDIICNKKESAAFLPKITDYSATPTDSNVSILNLFECVNKNVLLSKSTIIDNHFKKLYNLQEQYLLKTSPCHYDLRPSFQYCSLKSTY